MTTSPTRFASRWAGTLLAAALVIAAAVAVLLLQRPKILSIAVAPPGGTEPALIAAFASGLDDERKDVRLQIVPYPGLRESAQALESGAVDLAIVRPDLALPKNGLTLAVLRELAVLIAAPAKAGIKEASDLAGKRLAILAERPADLALVRALVGHVGLEAVDDPQAVRPSRGTQAKPRSVALVPLSEGSLAQALREDRVDALMLLTTPTTPAAQRLVRIVREASKDGEVVIVAIPDAAALATTMPRLQAVGVQAGLFGGNPRLPAEDLSTIGASHRLVARATLSRSAAAAVTQQLFEMRTRLADLVPSAEQLARPAYDTTADATSARLPVHPGAIDYFEREQESFIERYESWIYLVAIFGGGLGSLVAWLRRRIGRVRRERIGVATGRLLEIRSEARRSDDPDKLARLEDEVDSMAASIARHALRRTAETSSIEAASIAVDAARSTVRRAAERARAARPAPVPPPRQA